MHYFLAADIGGSKTVVNVYNQNNDLIKTYNTLGAGLSEDSNEDIPHISKLLEQISNEYSISSAAINLGGKNTGQIKQIFERFFNNAVIDIFRESDGTAALMLGQKYGSEVILLAGTGSIAIGYDQNEKYIVTGGWGADLCGDIGSGYDIGLKALHRSVLALDSIEPLTEMQKFITGCSVPISKETDITKIRDIRDGVRQHIGERNRRNIAAYAKVVTRFAEMGESDALEILSEAGCDLAKVVLNAINSLQPYEVKSVTVTGGLVNIKNYWENSFKEYLLKHSSVREFNFVDDGVILGTFLKAKENFKKENYK